MAAVLDLEEEPPISNRNHTPVLHTPTLIVGADPVGLTAALLLSRYSVPFRIIEVRPTAGLPPSKTVDCLNSRALEIFQTLGVQDELDRLGTRVWEYAFYSTDTEGNSVRTEIGPDVIHDTRFPWTLMIDKRDVEKTLIKALETEGHFVERNIEFLPDRPLLDNEFSTVYLLNHNTGEFETLDAGHILGCDGETSTVQKRAVISHQYLKVDENSGDETKAVEQRVNAAISPYTLPIERFLRIGTYKRRKHLTTQFRKAELHSFLLGDAAHSHSSFEASIEWWYYGCRGFAVDLTWKLALSYKGQASQRLLDTYEERREWYKEHMKLDKMLDKTIKIRVGDPEGSKGFSDLDMANGYISGLGARYSAVVQTRGNNLPFLDLKKDILTSGKRFPSLTLRRHLDGSKVDTLDELRLDGKFKVLVFVGHILESTVFANLSTCLLKWLANDSEKGLDQEKIVDFFLIHSGSRFYIMMFDFLQPFSEYAANIFEDENDTMHGFLGVNVNYGAICLLRPDGHVLVVGSLDDGLLVQEQLAKYLDM